jgi:hypothetical protein
MRKEWIKKTAALALSAAMIGHALAGCGAVESQIDETAVAATLGEEEILLKEVNFWAKYQEAIVNTSSQYYYSIFVNNGYDEEEAQSLVEQYIGGLDTVVDNVMESIETFHLLANHAEEYGVVLTEDDLERIDAAADQFLADNKASITALMSADKETVVEALKYYTLYLKMVPLMELDGLDEEVSDEDSLMKTYSYVYISLEGTVDEDGNTVEYTDAEKTQQGNSLQNFIDEFRASGESDFDSAAEEAGYTVSEHSYHPSDEDDTLADLNDVADGLTVGSVSDVIELNTEDELTGLAVLRLDTDRDLDAIEDRIEEILDDRKSACYTALLDSWKEEAEFVQNDDVLATIKVDDELYQESTSE